MASSKEYFVFVSEQLSDIPEISYRKMMGEYIVYFRGKVIGGIYDDRFLVKPTKSAVSFMPNARHERPYPGGKDMLLVEEVEDRDFLKKLIEKIADEISG